MAINPVNNSTISILEQVVQFTQSRHQVLAGNVANIDTPGYTTRDLSVDKFQSALQRAIEERDSPAHPISPGLVDTEPGDPMRDVRDSIKHILFHDGSDVSMEHQVAEISKNQALHNTAIAIMSSQFAMLQAAISERV